MSRVRALRPLLAFSGVLAIYFGLHFYIARRLLFDTELSGQVAAPASIAIAALGLSGIARMRGSRSMVSNTALKRWSYISYGWMGLAFLLCVGLGLSDLGLWLLRVSLADLYDWHALSTIRVRAVLVIVIAGSAAVRGAYNALRTPKIATVHLRLPQWPSELDGLRVLQLSDLHIGPMLEQDFLARVVAACNARTPDLVVLTGDIVDGSVERHAAKIQPLDGLESRLGVFMVTGNHDHYADETAWVPQLQRRGVQCLRNRCVELRGNTSTASFRLAGIDDTTSYGPTAIERTLTSLLGTTAHETPTLLLAHNPNAFEKAAHKGIALQLSGHTHGGQIWPFNYLVRIAHREVAGRYQHPLAHAQLYVSRGTGFWGPPMRLGAPSEITELIIHGPKSPN